MPGRFTAHEAADAVTEAVAQIARAEFVVIDGPRLLRYGHTRAVLSCFCEAVGTTDNADR